MHRLYLITVILLGTAAVHAYAVLPGAGPVRDEVGRLELNAYHDNEGRLIFRQLVGWDWSDREATWRCVFWRMAKSADLIPQRDWQRGGYVVLFNDDRVFREIRTASYQETWTQTDVEVEDRERLPVCQRRELTPCRAGRRK